MTIIQAYVRGANARDVARNSRLVTLTCAEILQTEKTYLADLQMVKKNYREPLESMAMAMKGIDGSQLPVIFSNLEFLIPVSQDLITALQACMVGHPDVARKPQPNATLSFHFHQFSRNWAGLFEYGPNTQIHLHPIY